MLEKVIHPELSYRITGICFDIHNELGRFLKEKQYADRLEQLLKQHKIEFIREYQIKVIYQSFPQIQIAGNRVDFKIENKVLLDCKAKPWVTREDYFQMQRYLTSAGIKLGLIINFRDRYVKPRRIINYNS